MISEQTPRQYYTGDGSTLIFAVPFEFFRVQDLVVYLTDTTTTPETDTLQVIDTDYLTSGGAGTGADPASGSIAFLTAPAAGIRVSIYLDPLKSQDAEFVDNDPFPASTLNAQLDKIVLMAQVLFNERSRSLGIAETETQSSIGRLPKKADRASNFLAFDSNADPIASAGVVPGSIPVSAFMATVLDDTTAGAALSTLGFSTYFKTLLAAATAAALKALVVLPGTVVAADMADNTITKKQLDTATTLLAGEIGNVGLACSVGSSALTIALKDSTGADPSASSPVAIVFRNATAATGTVSQVRLATGKSVVVSSGSTLGHTSAKEAFIYVYAMLFSGAVELAVSSTLYDEGTVQSSTAEGGAGAADSFTALYSTTARSNVPIRLIGRLRSTQTTAGTWAAVPTEISVSGRISAVPVVALAYRSTDQSIVDATDTTVVADTKILDTHGAYDNSTGIFTAPESGLYEVSGTLFFRGSAGFNGTTEWWRATVNPSVHSGGTMIQFNPPTAGSTAFAYSGKILVLLDKNETCTVKVQHTIGGGASVNLVGDTGCQICFRKLS